MRVNRVKVDSVTFTPGSQEAEASLTVHTEDGWVTSENFVIRQDDGVLSIRLVDEYPMDVSSVKEVAESIQIALDEVNRLSAKLIE